MFSFMQRMHRNVAIKTDLSSQMLPNVSIWPFILLMFEAPVLCLFVTMFLNLISCIPRFLHNFIALI